MARKQHNKNTRLSIGIIGEGITEWHYFNSLRQEKRYTFKLSPELPKHSDYKSIFKKAKALIKEGYDHVFCVLDLDVFKNDKKLEERYIADKNTLQKDKRIKVFETMPCFEYWFLLHFKPFSTRIYSNYDSLQQDIRQYLPRYEKSHQYLKRANMYQTLINEGNIDLAYESSSRLRAEKEDSDNGSFPFTEIDILLDEVDRLSVEGERVRW